MKNNVDVVDSVDIISSTNELCEFYTKLNERYRYLIGQISLCDKEINDIYHAAEFFNLNAAQGYKIYRMLHDVCIKRREYKNECEKIQMLISTKINIDNIEHVIDKIQKKHDNLTYKPRVLKELFEQ